MSEFDAQDSTDSASDGDVVSAASTRAPTLEQLERGLAVLQTFSRLHPQLTVSDAARLTGINRASARRILLTLERLGHVRQDDRYFSLTPNVLKLGWSYFASLGIDEVAQPILRDLTRRVDEACSLATLDGAHIVYVAREYGQHHMAVAASIGARLPAHATAAGQVLLSHLPAEEVRGALDGRLHRYTEHTVTDLDALSSRLEEAAGQGWALADQELELGLRAIAAPVRGADGRPVAAMSVSTNAARTSREDLQERCLPALLAATALLSDAFARGGVRRGR